MSRRKHQIDMEKAVSRIISGADSRDTILATVTPGGGKSTIPIIATRLIKAGLADKICWIVPRSSLQDQGERSFLDPFFRDMFDHRYSIRSSTNEINPFRSTDGFITTYQAIGADNTYAYQALTSYKTILILDEFHHVEKDSLWHKALEPLMEAAKYKILMTGTLERGNENQIAFIQYDENNMPIFDNMIHVNYGRTDALSEKAILPIKFHLCNGKVSWEFKNKVYQGDIDKFGYKEASGAIYTALNTEFAHDILNETVLHWRKWNQYHPLTSKLLVVCSDYESAVSTTTYIRKALKLNAQIATSRDSETAHMLIRQYKYSSDLNVLVTIAMAYEGMDCPPISHIACLTNIRSKPWIEQMVARGVRVWKEWGSYGKQTAHVFCPNDIVMRSVVDGIQAEQTNAAKITSINTEEDTETLDAESADGYGIRTPIYNPLSGSMSTRIEINLGDNNDCLNSDLTIKTISEQEQDLRKEINRHVLKFSFLNRYKPERINYELKQAFLISRSEMSLPQLKILLEYVNKNYPVKYSDADIPNQGKTKKRGSGIRLPTKAVSWEEKQQKLF